MSGTDNPGSTSKAKGPLGIPEDFTRIGCGLPVSRKDERLFKDWLRVTLGITMRYESWISQNVLVPWFEANRQKMVDELENHRLKDDGVDLESVDDLEALLEKNRAMNLKVEKLIAERKLSQEPPKK